MAIFLFLDGIYLGLVGHFLSAVLVLMAAFQWKD